MRGVIKKWGNSAAIRLPSSMMKSLRLGLEDLVDMRIERGSLVIQPLRSEEYVLTQLLSGIKPKNLHPEVDFGAAGVGAAGVGAAGVGAAGVVTASTDVSGADSARTGPAAIAKAGRGPAGISAAGASKPGLAKTSLAKAGSARAGG